MKKREYSDFLQTLHIWIIQEFFLPKRFVKFIEEGKKHDTEWSNRVMLDMANVSGWTYDNIGVMKVKAVKLMSLL